MVHEAIDQANKEMEKRLGALEFNEDQRRKKAAEEAAEAEMLRKAIEVLNQPFDQKQWLTVAERRSATKVEGSDIYALA